MRDPLFARTGPIRFETVPQERIPGVDVDAGDGGLVFNYIGSFVDS